MNCLRNAIALPLTLLLVPLGACADEAAPPIALKAVATVAASVGSDSDLSVLDDASARILPAKGDHITGTEGNQKALRWK
jgi:hypothetical protein